MASLSQLIDDRELAFQLYEVLGVESLLSRPRFAEHSRQTFDAALEAAAKIALNVFQPHHRKADLEEPRFVNGEVQVIPETAEAIRAFAESGLPAAGNDYAQGGMQLPWTVAQACYAHFHAANVATFAYCFLTIAAAHLIERFGTDDQKRRFMEPLLDGRALGTMCLSEPQVGSSLGDITTRATPLPNGTYRLRGTKMWISGGEHTMTSNIIHLVLAKIDGAPSGVKGISLFIAPRKRLDANGQPGEKNGITLVGLNHKMGYRGTVNTVLNLGESEDCIGELVGEPHQGLPYIFHMMNEARVVVGMSAAALGMAGYRVSLEYARARLQGRTPDAKRSPGQTPIINHADVRRLLLEQKTYAEGALSLGLYCAFLLDEQKTSPDEVQRKRSTLLLDILTPIMKAWTADWCLRANYNAIQVLGGAGYTRDHPVEQFYRDNRLNPIHEGTNGIQAIDLVGRKLSIDNGSAFAELVVAMRNDLQKAAGVAELTEHAASLAQAIELLERTTAPLAAASKGKSAGVDNATLYLDFLGHIVIAWVWLRQAAAAVSCSKKNPALAEFCAGKQHAAAFFFQRELPSVMYKAGILMSGDDLCSSMRDEWF